MIVIKAREFKGWPFPHNEAPGKLLRVGDHFCLSVAEVGALHSSCVVEVFVRFVHPVLWGACCLLTVAGCGQPDAENTPSPSGGTSANPGLSTKSAAKGPRLIFVTNSNADWWNAVEKGMLDGGAEFGCPVELKRNEAKVEGQIRFLEDALSQDDVKGVAVSVIEADAPGIADALNNLRKAGKAVISIDSDISPSAAGARQAYIGTDNRKAGAEAGRAAAILRPQGGKTAIFVGTGAAANAIERSEGFFTGAGPKFVKAELFEDGNDFARVSTNVQTAVTKYPDLGVLLGLWSYNAPRIAEEVANSSALRKQVSVVTFDLDELSVGHLEKGMIDASVCQNPYDMGYKGVRLLKALVEKDQKTIDEMLPNKATTIETGVRIIVPKADSPVKGDNVITIEEMKKWLASKGLKSS